MKRVGIIMAGGAGERFWPLSRQKFPKQLLPLGAGNKSILEESIERAATVINYEDIFIITNELLVEVMRESLPILPPENIIPEPFKRNTAPCLALANAYISARYSSIPPNEISVAVLTADQNIKPIESFTKTLDFAMNYAENSSSLVTIGIPPVRPETGYGYIETKERFTSDSSLEIKPVLQFREKPNLELAKEFISTERFVWNSGMFFWRYDVFVNEIKQHYPEIGNQIDSLKNILIGTTNKATLKLSDEIAEIFRDFTSISIDYALMEKSKNVMVCKAIFDWDDIGSWDSLDRTKSPDSSGNILQGEVSLVNSKNSILINKSKNKRTILAGLDVENMIVVVTDDAVLVCPKSQSQNIKKIVEDVREKFGEDFL